MAAFDDIPAKLAAVQTAIDNYNTAVTGGDETAIGNAYDALKTATDDYGLNIVAARAEEPSRPERDFYQFYSKLGGGRIAWVRTLFRDDPTMVPPALSYLFDGNTYLSFGDINSPANSGAVSFALSFYATDIIQGERQTIFVDGGWNRGWVIGIDEDGLFEVAVKDNDSEESVVAKSDLSIIADRRYNISGYVDPANSQIKIYNSGVELGQLTQSTIGDYNGGAGTFVGAIEQQDPRDAISSGPPRHFF